MNEYDAIVYFDNAKTSIKHLKYTINAKSLPDAAKKLDAIIKDDNIDITLLMLAGITKRLSNDKKYVLRASYRFDCNGSLVLLHYRRDYHQQYETFHHINDKFILGGWRVHPSGMLYGLGVDKKLSGFAPVYITSKYAVTKKGKVFRYMSDEPLAHEVDIVVNPDSTPRLFDFLYERKIKWYPISMADRSVLEPGKLQTVPALTLTISFETAEDAMEVRLQQ